MSALLHPVPQPVKVPPQAPAPMEPRRPRRSPLVWGVILLAAVAGGWLAWQQFQPSQKPVATLGVPTAKATVQPLVSTIRLAGETGAVDFANVVAPNLTGPDSGRDLVILQMAESGAFVKRGALLAEIDGQALKDHVDDVNSTVLQAQSDVVKRQAEQSIESESLAQMIRQAKAEWEKLKLESQAAEVKTAVDRQLLKLGVEEAEAQYRQLVADSEIYNDIHAAEKQILELTTQQHERHRDRHAVDYTKFKVYSPMDGMVVRQQIRRGMELAQVRVGDQISPRQTFLKVVDTSSMQLDGHINQAHSSHLKVGQKARVGLDAFPGLEFEGEVYSIGALAAAGSMSNDYIRRLPVRIRINGQHPKLIPSMSGWADVQIASTEGKVVIPRAAVYEEAGGEFVYVKKGASFERRQIVRGPSSDTQASVTAGVQAGEEVALRRPETTNS